MPLTSNIHTHTTSYLKDISIDGCYSNYSNVPIGVPQGIVLAPLFFLIYNNDIIHYRGTGKVIFCADDAVKKYNLQCETIIISKSPYKIHKDSQFKLLTNVIMILDIINNVYYKQNKSLLWSQMQLSYTGSKFYSEILSSIQNNHKIISK